jgi:hypothetical protein
VPEGGTKPKIRIVAHLQAGTRRWKAAAVGGYHDGENALADELEGSLSEGMLNLADRGFFSMSRWMRFSGTGAHLLWRVKNSARSVPFKTIRTLADGSELVLLRESSAMLGTRRRDAGDKTLPRLPDTVARLVSFTVLTRARSGRMKTTAIRVLTTLLDQDLYPAGELAALYAKALAGGNRVLAPEENRARPPPRPARTLRHARPPGSLGAAARPQHDRRDRGAGGLQRRLRSRCPLIHRRAVPGPLPRHR